MSEIWRKIRFQYILVCFAIQTATVTSSIFEVLNNLPCELQVDDTGVQVIIKGSSSGMLGSFFLLHKFCTHLLSLTYKLEGTTAGKEILFSYDQTYCWTASRITQMMQICFFLGF